MESILRKGKQRTSFELLVKMVNKHTFHGFTQTGQQEDRTEFSFVLFRDEENQIRSLLLWKEILKEEAVIELKKKISSQGGEVLKSEIISIVQPSTESVIKNDNACLSSSIENGRSRKGFSPEYVKTGRGAGAHGRHSVSIRSCTLPTLASLYALAVSVRFSPKIKSFNCISNIYWICIFP